MYKGDFPGIPVFQTSFYNGKAGSLAIYTGISLCTLHGMETLPETQLVKESFTDISGSGEHFDK